MKTAVSVIVPCYNVAPYVDECMSGLAEQTLGPMEIICVDDGSTDGTLELLYRWREKDNRLRVISQSNAGVSAARNAGLDAAEGKYVGFVDPDDRVDRRMFSRLLGAAEKNDADVVVCGCREFVEKDGVAVHEGGWSPDDEFYPEERVEQFRRGSAWCRCVGPVYNKLVRRSLVEEHSLRFVVGLKEGEDLAFLLMLLPLPFFDGDQILSFFLPPKWVYFIEQNGMIISLVVLVLLVSGALSVPLDAISTLFMKLFNFIFMVPSSLRFIY